jgi:hypothetical protein
MCQELTDELDKGAELAAALVQHVIDMGSATATIPVKHDGDFYEVTVKKAF